MATISVADAESRFSEILERVSHGEEIVLTKDDRPIARLVPEERRDLEAVRRAVEDLRALQREMESRPGFEPLTDEEILSAIGEGRRY
jgi:prevent-host-death family protein